jgi:hypothetical protein
MAEPVVAFSLAVARVVATGMLLEPFNLLRLPVHAIMRRALTMDNTILLPMDMVEAQEALGTRVLLQFNIKDIKWSITHGMLGMWKSPRNSVHK